jgi:hypothetical protein
MDEKPDKTWTIVRLKAYLKGKIEVVCLATKLHLAILYADDFESGLGTNSTAATISEAQLTNFRESDNYLAKCP